MSADAFSAFEEVELSNRSALREVGRTCVSYETLLARYERSVIFICYQCIIRALFLSSHGVFQDFRGRPSSSHALFKSDGFARHKTSRTRHGDLEEKRAVCFEMKLLLPPT